MENIKDFALKLGPSRLSAIGGATLFTIAFFIFIIIKLSSPNMTTLFTSLDNGQSSQIIGQLSQRGVKFELKSGGSEILVPSDKLQSLRLDLSELGLSGRITGYEIFDNSDAIGSSSFIQEINRLRALEGELARTIVSISGVRGARVHLVLPEKKLFSRDTRKVTASITLRMSGVYRLDSGQIKAIKYLVSSSVPNLSPNNVSIIDNQGTLLASAGAGEEGSGEVESFNDMQIKFESRLATKIEEVISKTVGYGKVRANVTALMNFDKSVINKEDFDPEQQILRSNIVIEEGASENDASSDVSVAGNLPGSDFNSSTTPTTTSNRTEDRSNYEIGRTLTNTVIAPGKIERLSIGILIDGSYTTDDDGVKTYIPRTQQDIDDLRQLITTSIGFDEIRGDSIEIINKQFVEIDAQLIEENILLFGLKASDITQIIQTLILGFVALLVVLLVVRPLVGKMFDASITTNETEYTPEQLAGSSYDKQIAENPSFIERDGLVGSLSGQDGSYLNDAEMQSNMNDAGIDLDSIDGKVQSMTLRKITDTIEHQPEIAVGLIRGWIYQDRE